ncbi:MAG: peptidylprolyl isomerase [Candidatus Cloacimonetes bacterium]|nr:peptidylprolyl isomerase [Candidatus Cloacimonadota bacterium]
MKTHSPRSCSRIHRRMLLLASAAGLWLGAVSCARAPMTSAAIIDGDTLSMDDYRSTLSAQFKGADVAAAQPVAKRQEVLERMVRDRLIAKVARDEGWYERPEYLAQKTDYENEGIEREIYEMKVAAPLLTDSLLMDTWNRQGTEVKASHILFRWSDDSTAVRQKASTVYEEVMGGLPFAEAAAKYTEEPAGKQRGGELGWFTWGSMDPSFQQACWGLDVGSVSQPVETSFGVHLIALEDRRAVQVRPSFEESKDDLKQAARNSMRNEMIARGMAYIDSLHQEYGVTILPGVVADLHRELIRRLVPEKNFLTLLTETSEAWGDRPLIHWVEGDVGIEELKDYLGKRYHAFTVDTPQSEIERILKDMMLPRLLAKKGRAMNLDQAPDVVEQVNKRLDRAIQVEYENQHFKAASAVTDAEIAARYEAQPDSFMHEPMVRVQEILVDDSDLATMLCNRARSGEESFDSLAEAYTTRPGKKPLRGNLEAFAAGRYDAMGEKAFTMEVGEISDPIALGNKWSVIKLLEKLPSRRMRLDEASTKIRYAMEREKRDALEAEFLARAKAAHPTIINERAAEIVYQPTK